MKKIILASLLAISPILAKDSNTKQNPFLHGDNFPRGYALTAHAMPNFMHLYMKDGGMFKIEGLTEQQEDTIEKTFSKMPKKIMKLAREVKALETTLAFDVIDNGKEAKDVSDVLDKIAQKKKKITVLKIECLSVFKKTLTPKQYKVLRDMAIAMANN
ncbi:MAG: hypothetical protein U9N11_03645 [Campylobacterota bacterium]|nr:hypothetical protein [Campylobacterota bacterium]